MLDDLARDVHAHTVGFVVAAAVGQPVGEVPDWDTVRTAFDRGLAEPPEPDRPDTAKAIKMRALGLTGGG